MTKDRQGSLTTTDFWSDQWEALSLPYRVDLDASYTWQCFAKLFHDVLPTGRMRLLEVGSGACQWLGYFRDTFEYDVYGLDNAVRACIVGRRNLELQGVEPRVVCGDLRSPPVTGGAFDIVFSAGVVEHFGDVHVPLESMAQLVSPGGWLLTTVPNFAGWVGLMRRITDAEVFAMHEVVTASDLLEAYEALGFQNVRVGYFGSLRMPDYVPSYRHSLLPHRRIGWAASRAADRTLTSLYRRTGLTLDSPWLSYNVYAVGQRGSAR